MHPEYADGRQERPSWCAAARHYRLAAVGSWRWRWWPSEGIDTVPVRPRRSCARGESGLCEPLVEEDRQVNAELAEPKLISAAGVAGGNAG